MLFESRMVSYSHFLRTEFGLWNQGWQLFLLSKDSSRSLKSRMAGYYHFQRTVSGLWNQGWQAIPTFWGQYLVFEIKDGKLFPPSEDSIWALKSRMVSYFHPLRTVWGLWNQGWQAIPIFENSIWSLKSRMPAIPTFRGQYVILYQNMVDCWLPLGFEARRWVGEGWRAV